MGDYFARLKLQVDHKALFFRSWDIDIESVSRKLVIPIEVKPLGQEFIRNPLEPTWNDKFFQNRGSNLI